MKPNTGLVRNPDLGSSRNLALGLRGTQLAWIKMGRTGRTTAISGWGSRSCTSKLIGTIPKLSLMASMLLDSLESCAN
ncbi:hypothetical protein SLEP1_g52302 [Rubroshorea leprosula]|uniref:Uncharacterized protein n=1 Tax=Rubroshorea leprosula TaxID=152421 RepID=A0AAV5M8I0_9ROSI|nr:hypothetical protein SLEP1_g52302 [Rubroshorea leprosula]